MAEQKMGKDAENSENSRSKVVLNAIAMSLGTLTSRSLGLLREMAFAALFSREITDAWIAAFRLPNMFRRLFGEGSLNVSFIPVFVEARLQDLPQDGGPSPRAQNLVNGFYTLLLILLSVITLIGVLKAEWVLNFILDPVYVQQTAKFALTVRMAKIMFIFVFLVSTYAYFMGILNALGKYGLAATAPALFNISMIVSTFLPTAWFPFEGDGLAWGVVVGGILQAAILIPSLVRFGYFPKVSFSFSKDVLKVLVGMGPGLIGLGLLQITTIINMRFASELGEGPISWINWADRLLELPLSLISVSLGAALLPTLAGMWTKNEKQNMSETTNYYLRLNIYMSLAAAVGLFTLAQPIVEVLYMRGRFTMADAVATAGVVQVWALIMIPTSCVRVLAPAYYAIKNTWYPAVVSAICLVVHVTIAPLLMKAYGLPGLNSSSLLSSSLNFGLLMVMYPFLVTSFNYQKLFKQILKFIVAGFALAGATLVYEPLHFVLGGSWLMKVLALGTSILLGMIAFGFVSHFLRLEEYEQTAKKILGRIFKNRT